MAEEYRALFLLEEDGRYVAVNPDGSPANLPAGVTPVHVAGLLALLEAGNAVPLLRALPPSSLMRVELPPGNH